MDKIFDLANKAIVEDIKTELRLQGHHFTGALEASIQDRIIEDNGSLVLTAEALSYLEDLEKGIPANEIPNRTIDLPGLASWVRIKSIWRGCSEKQSFKIALTIIKKWKKEGFELEGAKFFSSTGKVDRAVSETFEKNQDEYFTMIDQAAIGRLDDIFSSIKSGTI